MSSPFPKAGSLIEFAKQKKIATVASGTMDVLDEAQRVWSDRMRNAFAARVFPSTRHAIYAVRETRPGTRIKSLEPRVQEPTALCCSSQLAGSSQRHIPSKPSEKLSCLASTRVEYILRRSSLDRPPRGPQTLLPKQSRIFSISFNVSDKATTTSTEIV